MLTDFNSSIKVESSFDPKYSYFSAHYIQPGCAQTKSSLYVRHRIKENVLTDVVSITRCAGRTVKTLHDL